MNWSFGASPGVFILAAALFAGCAWISYLNWQRNGKRSAIGRLEFLRLVLIALLGFTLLRPEIVQVVKSKSQPELAVLVDRSGSMDTRDVQTTSNITTRTEWISRQLSNEFWQPLQGKTR